MDATIELHLTSIDLLLSVKVDSRNRINSVSTIYTPGKMKTVSISIIKDSNDSIIVDKISLAFRQKYHTLMNSYSEEKVIDFSIDFEL